MTKTTKKAVKKTIVKKSVVKKTIKCKYETTLALNMIVGKGEAHLLQSCFDSLPEGMFDQGVIVDTGNDPNVRAVATKAGAQVVSFDWKTKEHPWGDFGGARNAALDITNTDWFMWLDADDKLEFEGDAKEKVQTLRKLLDKIVGKRDVVFARYVLTKENDMPVITNFRERIMRNNYQFRWKHKVHELCVGCWDSIKHAKLNGLDIVHYPEKPSFSSAMRNAQILEHEYFNNNKRDEHTRYFLARDYMIIGKVEEAIPIYEDMVREFQGTEENRYFVAFNAACWYLYGGFSLRPKIEDVKLENANMAEGWLKTALSLCSGFAEPYVMLGDLYLRKGQEPKAEEMYLQALQKNHNHGALSAVTYYEELPAQRLAGIYAKINENEKALWYNKRALLHYASNNMVELRRLLLNRLNEEYRKNIVNV